MVWGKTRRMPETIGVERSSDTEYIPLLNSIRIGWDVHAHPAGTCKKTEASALPIRARIERKKIWIIRPRNIQEMFMTSWESPLVAQIRNANIDTSEKQAKTRSRFDQADSGPSDEFI